jgi:cation diffusion facilitator CzcD-associated flavoprotein CzcO
VGCVATSRRTAFARPAPRPQRLRRGPTREASAPRHLHCATCDGDFFTGRPIAVVGGGNSALEEAVSLSPYASEITVIHEFDHFQAKPWIVAEAEDSDPRPAGRARDAGEWERPSRVLMLGHPATGTVREAWGEQYLSD